MIQGNPAQKLVYTYKGKKVRDGCEKCKEADILTIKDDKIYLFMYFGDVQKYDELLPTALNIFNSTDIGFQIYENAALDIQIKYPRNWDKVQNNTSVSFFAPQILLTQLVKVFL
jgi:hypothetical protein